MPFTAISPKLLKLQPRRGGGLASFFGGDFGAAEAGADRLAGVGVTGRAGALAAVEAGADRFAGAGAVQIPLVAPTLTGPTQVNSTTLRVGISGGSGATSWTLQKSTDGGTTWSSAGSVTVGATQADATVTTGQSTQLRIAASDGVDTEYSNVVTGSTSSGTGTELYFEDWESAALGSNANGRGANGFTWGGHLGSGGVAVSDWNSNGGTKSMRFSFLGGPAGTQYNAQLAFDLGTGYREVTLEYDIYIPDGTESYGGAAYTHRSHVAPLTDSNHKFFRLFPATAANWGYDSTEKVGASLYRKSSTGLSQVNIEFNLGGGMGEGGGAGNTRNDFIEPADLGTWISVKLVCKAPTADVTGPGLIQIWKNGVKVDEWAPDNYAAGQPHNLQRGYLFGAPNGGFAEDTYIFLDNFRATVVA